MNEVKKQFDQIAEEYDRQRRSFIPHYDDFYSTGIFMVELETDQPEVLDIGAGTGAMSAYFLQRFPNAKITLLDISDKMLEVAKRRFEGNPNISYRISDYAAEPIEGSYDAAISALSVHHLEDRDKAHLYQEVHRILKHGGCFVNAEQTLAETEHLRELYMAKWREFIETSGLHKDEIDAGFERRKLDKVALLEEQLIWLREAGFTDVTVPYRYLHFAVMFARKT